MAARYSQAQNRATQKYIKGAYDEIKIRMQKGEKEKLKQFVEEVGYISMNQFIVDAVEHYQKAVLRDEKENQKRDEEIIKIREAEDQKNEKKLLIVKGHFLEGEKVTVSIEGDEVQRKVYYSKEAGDLFIWYKRNRYFYCEFQ